MLWHARRRLYEGFNSAKVVPIFLRILRNAINWSRAPCFDVILALRLVVFGEESLIMVTVRKAGVRVMAGSRARGNVEIRSFCSLAKDGVSRLVAHVFRCDQEERGGDLEIHSNFAQRVKWVRLFAIRTKIVNSSKIEHFDSFFNNEGNGKIRRLYYF